MALKSFPDNANERELVWCLEASAIDQALKDDKSKELIQAKNITVVQLPLSRLAKKKSKVLEGLEQQGLLSHDQFLMLGKNDALEKEYFKVDDVIKDFLDAMLQKASGYNRFFAVLGASSIRFESRNHDSSDLEASISTELDGSATKVVGAKAEVAIQAKKVLQQMIQMSSEFETQKMTHAERVSKVERVLKECRLENDQICKSSLAMLKDGSKQKKFDLEMEQSGVESNNLKALLNLKLRIPLEATGEFNLASLQGAINIATAVEKSLKLKIVVDF